jgi:hypothetical protein
MIDLDKFRARWKDPEFVKSYAQLDQESNSEIIERMKRMDRRNGRWLIIRKILMRAPLLILIVLAVKQIYFSDRQESSLQIAAFMIEMAAFGGLLKLDKVRENYKQPRYWLSTTEFLRDEQQRINRNIRFDLWASLLLSLVIVGAGLYAIPFLSASRKLAFLALPVAAIIVLLVYEYRRISRNKRLRDDAAKQLELDIALIHTRRRVPWSAAAKL